MAVLQSDIDALNKAIASGERQIALGAKQITYRSIDDLIKARNDLEAQMAKDEASAAGTPIKRRVYAYYGGRGYQE